MEEINLVLPRPVAGEGFDLVQAGDSDTSSIEVRTIPRTDHVARAISQPVAEVGFVGVSPQYPSRCAPQATFAEKSALDRKEVIDRHAVRHRTASCC